jgi:hypothetical protein
MNWLQKLPSNPFKEARSWLLIGSAGSGKSYQISRVIDELLAEGVKASDIMYILFNHEPAVKFKEKYFLRNFSADDLTWWGTHHSIAKKLMKINGNKILEGKRLIEWGKERGYAFDSCRSSFKTDSDNILSSLDTKLYSLNPKLTKQEQRLLGELQKSELEKGMYTHTRYLYMSCFLNKFPEEVKYVLVDEAQDNGRLQLEWLQRVLTRPQIKGMLLAGDDKQAINSFKGSDPKLFLNFEAEKKVALNYSYRCPQKVLNEANKLINPIKNRSPLADVSLQENKGSVTRSGILADLSFVLLKKLKAGEKILGLVRNNFVKKSIMDFCLASGLPVLNPKYESIALILQALRKIHESKVITEAELGAIVPDGQFGRLYEHMCFRKGVSYKLRNAKFEDDDDLKAAYYMARLDGGLPLIDAEMIGLKPEFVQAIYDWDLPYTYWKVRKEDIYGLKQYLKRLASGMGSMQLLTIHGAKGLEADNVVVFVDVASKTMAGEMDNPDTERRVWYVAMTRSSKNLYLTKINFENKTTNLICL